MQVPFFVAVVCLSFFAIVMLLLGLFFYVRWKKAEELLEEKQQVMLALSSLDEGYYYWDATKDSEFFSPHLYVLFQMKSDICSLKELAKRFTTQKVDFFAQVAALKSCQEVAFVCDLDVDIAGYCHVVKASGKRVEDSSGNLRGIIIWFYDVSVHIAKYQEMLQESLDMQHQLHNMQRIVDVLPVPVWKRDHDYNLLFANQKYHDFIEEERFSSSLDKALVIDDASPKGKAFFQHKHVVIDGERKLFAVHEMFDGEQYTGFAYDVSYQEEVEAELERHISAHSDLLESSSSAMAVYGRDMELKFFNNAYVRLWGFSEKWLSSGPSYSEVLEYLRERRRLPEQVNFREFKRLQLQLFKDIIKPVEEVYHLPDGKALRVIAIPHALGGVLFAYEDITDRLAMERSYNTLIAVQQATLDNLNEGIAVFGEDGRLKLYNPQYVKIWPNEEDVLQASPHISDLIEHAKPLLKYEGSWKAFKDALIAQNSQRKASSRRLELTNNVVIDKTTVPLPDGATLVSYVDVTDSILVERSLRERNEALEAADRLKKEFLASVSYELRTPLTSIMGFSEALLGEYFGNLNQKQEDYIRDILGSTNHLMNLINDILDLASMEAGRMELHIKEFDIYAALSSLVQLLREPAKNADVSVSLECRKSIGKLSADEKRIKQVLFNLLSNAIKFTPKGGSIRVGAKSKAEGQVVIWIEDTGIGISAEELPNVFDRFYKSEAAYSMNHAGTGLGLSVVKHIVELHGGTVNVESALGKGTRVECCFGRSVKPLPSDEPLEQKVA